MRLTSQIFCMQVFRSSSVTCLRTVVAAPDACAQELHSPRCGGVGGSLRRSAIRHLTDFSPGGRHRLLRQASAQGGRGRDLMASVNLVPPTRPHPSSALLREGAARSGHKLLPKSPRAKYLGGPGVVGSFGGVCRDLHVTQTRYIQNVAFRLTRQVTAACAACRTKSGPRRRTRPGI